MGERRSAASLGDRERQRLEGRLHALLDDARSHLLSREWSLGSPIPAILLVLGMATLHLERQVATADETRRADAREASGKAYVPADEGNKRAEVPVDLYGDPLPAGAAVRLGTERLRFTGWNKSLAFAQDNRTLITATAHHSEIRIWDAHTGQRLGEINTAPFPPRQMRMLPDGQTLITYGTHFLHELKQLQHVLLIWDVPSRRLQSVVPIHLDTDPHDTVTSLEITPDGKTVVLGTATGDIRQLDLESGQELRRRRIAKHNIDAIAISPDGECLAATTRDGLQLWKWLGDEDPERPEQQQPQIRIMSLAFSPDGKTLAMQDTRQRVVLWNVAEKRIRLVIDQHVDGLLRLRSMTFVNGGETLVAANQILEAGHETGALLWDATMGERTGRFAIGYQGAGALAVSPDGTLLAAMGDSACRVWELNSGRELSEQLIGHMGPISSVVFAREDAVVITSDYEGTVRVWDAWTGKQLRIWDHGSWIGAVAVSPDGKWIASSADDLRVWDAKTGEEKYRRTGHGFGARRALAFTPKGRQLISWGDDDLLRRWDMQTGELLHEHRVSPHPAGPKLSEYTRSSDLFALASDTRRLLVTAGNEVHVFDTASGEELYQYPIIGVRTGGRELQLSPDGAKLLVTAVEDPNVRDQCTTQLVDATTGNVIWQKKLPRGACGPTGFSPDGTLVATTVLADGGIILVCDAATGDERIRLDGIPKSAWGGRGRKLAFSTDNRRLAVAMMNTTTLIWNIDPGQ